MCKLLAIDDRADNLVALKALLKNVKPDYTVMTALSGPEGIQKAEDLETDIVLLDISMPEMDGFEVCAALKNNDKTRHIPVILLTAYHTDAKSRVYGLEQGADAFLSKPIDEGELIAQVNAMLRLKSAEDRLRNENIELERRVHERTEDLDRSRQQFQFLFDFAPDIYCSLDRNSTIVKINQYGANYLGFARQELTGRLFFDLVVEKDAQIAQRMIEDVHNHRERQVTTPFRLKRKDGDSIWVALRGNVPQHIGGDGSEALLILHDVTEEQRVLDTLRENEKMLRTLYNNLSIGIYRSTQEGRILFANPALLNMLQVESLEELQASDISEQFAYNRSDFESIIQKYSSVRGYETRIRRKDGTWLDVRENAVMVPQEGGVSKYYEGTIEDISQKVKTERELLVSERRFRLIAEMASDAILGFDSEGKLLIWNSAAAGLFYLNDERAPAFFISDLIYDLSKDKMFEYAGMQKKATDRALVIDVVCARTDASRFPAELTLSAIESFDRVKVFALVRDTSMRKKELEERQQALDLAQEALRVKSLFIANMSHEIRTPLNSMLGFVSLLEEDLRDSLDEAHREYFRIIQESGSRLLTTVHHILDLSRLDSGGIKEQRERFDLLPVVQDAIKELQPIISEKGLTSGLISEDEEMTVEADRFMVLQALLNIIENAVKYSERGGILVRAGRSDGSYYVAVKDTGIGISEEFLPRLFLEFTQESEGYTKRYQGLGLGLVLAKRYIELNGGSIEVESRKHQGSVFTIRLPVPQEDFIRETTESKEGEE